MPDDSRSDAYVPIRDYAIIGDSRSAALDLAHGLDRLALLAALRQPLGLRAHPRRESRRLLLDPAVGPVRDGAPLRRRDERARDDVHHERRQRAHARPDAGADGGEEGAACCCRFASCCGASNASTARCRWSSTYAPRPDYGADDSEARSQGTATRSSAHERSRGVAPAVATSRCRSSIAAPRAPSSRCSAASATTSRCRMKRTRRRSTRGSTATPTSSSTRRSRSGASGRHSSQYDGPVSRRTCCAARSR